MVVGQQVENKQNIPRSIFGYIERQKQSTIYIVFATNRANTSHKIRNDQMHVPDTRVKEFPKCS